MNDTLYYRLFYALRCSIYENFLKVLEERNQLHAAWQQKKVYLDQLIDLQFFLRDAKQLDTISSSQEATLSTADFGTTIEEVDAQVKECCFFPNNGISGNLYG